ncbi:MAG: hypothetical protein ABJN40_05800 [Sneathiella sp.]
MDIKNADFDGKVVSFGSVDDTLAIKNIRFEYQNDRLFVLGIVPEGATDNDWAVNRPCAIAWDSVTDYMIFDSEAQYVELMAKTNK